MSFQDELDNYRQIYLNEKNKGRLPPLVFLNQPTNKGTQLRLGKGRFGDGVYASGQIVNRNKDNPPNKYQHAVAPELILDASDFQEKYNNDMSAADRDGYVGVRYDRKEDSDKASYYIFPNTVPVKEDGKTNASNISIHTHPITNKQTKMVRDGVRWSIDGVDKQFRSKEKVIKYLERDIDFLNQQGDNPNA